MPPPGRAGLEPAVHGLNTRHTHQPSPRGPAGSPQLPPHGAAPLTAAQENLPGSLLLVCCSRLGGKALQEVLEDALSRGMGNLWHHRRCRGSAKQGWGMLHRRPLRLGAEPPFWACLGLVRALVSFFFPSSEIHPHCDSSPCWR